jgi:CheY-like chemotaxis protein
MSKGSTAAPAAPAAAARILLVEDGREARDVMTAILQMAGYVVETAENAAEGLRRLSASRFDLVLCHYSLPDQTAASMLKEASRLGALRRTPAVVMTAHPDPEGVDDLTVIKKPFDVRAFLDQIAALVKGRHHEAAVPGPREDLRSGAGGSRAHFVLYVSPNSPASARALRIFHDLLAAVPPARVSFETCDVSKAPDRAEADRVVFTPTLVKVSPEPRAWVVGDLTNPGIVGEILTMCLAESG